MTKQNETQTVEKVDLTKLAEEINQQHEHCLEASRTTLAYAVKTGELLIQAKEAVKRGEWGTWVEANCHFGLREAQRYMKVAKDLSKLENEDLDTSDMTLTDVLGHLKKLSTNENITEDPSESVDPNRCFRLSEAEQERRVRQFTLSPKTFPDTVTEEAEKVVGRVVAQIRRAIRTGALKHIRPKIEGSSLETADIAILLFEELRRKLTVASLFDDLNDEETVDESNGRVATVPETKPNTEKRPTRWMTSMRCGPRYAHGNNGN